MLDSKIKNALFATPLSQHLEHQELETLISYSDIVSFSPNDVILEQGNYSPGVYIIINGCASRTARTLESGITTIALLNEGDFIGEISLISNEPSATSIVATTPVTTLLIKKTYWNFLSAFLPEEKTQIMMVIAKRICGRMKNIHDKIIASIQESNMITQSLFGKVIESLTNAAETTYQEMNLDTKKLYQMDIFSSFNAVEYEELLKRTTLIKAAKHCPIIKEVDKQSGCYIVLRGAVQSSVIHNNIVAKLSVIGPSLLFSSVSTIDSEAASLVNYTTCEQVILLKFTQAELEYIRQNNKSLWVKIFNLICKSLVALEKSMQKLDIRLNIELYNR